MSLRSLSKNSGRSSLIALFFFLTLFSHYAWEIGQIRFFASFQNTPFRSYALHCFVASLGDVVIATIAYVGVAALTRNWDWFARRVFSRPLILWLLFGEIMTVAFELYALSAKRWAYAESMPTVLGVGLAPLLQWILIPSLTAFVMRIVFRLGCAQGEKRSRL